MVMDVLVGCPVHETHRVKPLDEARETIREHNENMHEGEQVAGIRFRVGEEIEYMPHPKDADEDDRERAVELLKKKRQ